MVLLYSTRRAFPMVLPQSSLVVGFITVHIMLFSYIDRMVSV